LIAGCFVGVVAGLLIGAAISRRKINELATANRKTLAELNQQNAQTTIELSKLRSKNKSLRAAVDNARTEYESVRKKAKLLAKNLLTLREERQTTKVKVNSLQHSLVSFKEHTLALQTEFDKVREFYKRELVKSLAKRKDIQQELEELRAEQQAFTKQVESSVLEHGSPEEMIAAAQLRFGQIEMLERTVSKLEAENSGLRDDAKRMKQDYETLEKDLSELDELRINNQQLIRCVESLESARQEHEKDAHRYRDRADQTEQVSETLRLKLNDLEKNFAEIEMQQQEALEQARREATFPKSSSNESFPPDEESQEDIVGLAKWSNRG